MLPDDFPCGRIQAVEPAGIVRDIQQAVGDGRIGERAIDRARFPDGPAGQAIDARQQALAGAVLRALANRHVDLARMDERRGDDFTGPILAFLIPAP